MSERKAAEEHLRVIRSLMERATVYRAISAPTALVGGLTALAASGWLISRASNAALNDTAGTREFMFVWFVALGITLAANTFFLWQGAWRGHRPFLSAGLRLALRSVIPSLFVTGALTFFMAKDEDSGPTAFALTWICLYGLALLSTMNFAPRSLSILGWCFLLAGTLLLLVLAFGSKSAFEVEDLRGATYAMAVTFGLFHLIYAACIWSRRGETDQAPFAPE